MVTRKKTSKAGSSKSARKAAAPTALFMRVAKPDPPDARDRPFRPQVGVAPAATLFPATALPVKHQGDTNACTGFSLALVVEHLLRRSAREKTPAISSFMLYSMARRYDEFPGSAQDKGSSLRGALKGWYKHGACREALFQELAMPPASKKIEDDWWFDAVKRPLGAYYRIDTRSLSDMHAALNEVGILYASAGCHSGWDEGLELPPMAKRPTSFKNVWEIPVKGGQADHPGHAFAIVGYNERGFLIQNSWGPTWGSHGYGVLTYDDWLRNAMDCWVAQLGVVTRDHTEISRSITLRTDREGRVALAASEVLRNREISPFIINMGNNGALSNSGVFRTQPDDVRALIDVHLAEARKRWGLGDGVVDVCIYAHGGLVGEQKAAEIAAQWVPMLYEHQIFPVFLMWETDFFSTLLNLITDAIKDVPRSTGFGLKDWWNERLEQLVARPGTRLWGEMKQNADAMSAYREGVPDDEQAGLVLLYRHFKHAAANKKLRLHVVGHSAGSIVSSFMIDRLVQEGMRFESVSFMAPAVRIDWFDRRVRPHMETGAVKRYQQFHLTDRAEQDDGSCGAYRRSLLYLVSEAFEGGQSTPILGMQKFFDVYGAGLPNTLVHLAPGPVSSAKEHGEFDDDPGTRQRVLEFIQKG
ncbi:C1 family peptidase [Piscinibacter gummiphilus]|uniref:C1 family peptidase n=1 Tax=Piscinibacter gummiphilus TaxID=946333 RepID=A0ABZ0CPC5_9BURK|nr:C1 family peptidase [Piscinibacter gummiphilus]WOB06829.1 C1 family peptidase [Piscinibacter gummiphilus]